MLPLDEQKISYLIVGNGIAGATAAETLRAADPQASIAVIADTLDPVYYRPALKDYLGGHVPLEKLWARPTSFYQDLNISLLPGRVIGLDSQYHIVLLQNQKQVRYRKLLLANGANPARLNCPGNNLRGVTTLRTVTDYQNVLERLNSVRRVVVSGSGTLALETVESLRQRGMEVTHLLRHSTLWSEVLDTTASDLVLQEERRAGVEVRLEEEIVKITGRRGEVSGVITNQGRRISCQMVLVAIGIEPNIKPWQICGVNCGRGVLVDDTLRTNLPDIYAAGDLTETYNSLTNRTRVLGQWYPAIQQARNAAYSMLERPAEVEPFRAETFYNATFLYGLDFASAGLTITPDLHDYQELVAEPQPRSYRKVILKDGIPVGLLALGDRKQAQALKRAMDYRVNLLSVADRLFSADFNLRAWLDEQDIGGEKIMLDSIAGLTPGIGADPIPTDPTDYEALLVHIVDPALRLQIAETPLHYADTSPLYIGRQAGVYLLLDEGSISRQHAEISYTAGQYLLRDLGSTNGTFVNEQRLDASRPYVLQPNDVLRFGNIVRLQFLLRVNSYRLPIPPALDQENRRDNTSRLSNPQENRRDSALPLSNPQENRRDSASPLPDPQENRRDSALPLSDQYAAAMLNTPGEADTYLEQLTTRQAFLNRDGTLLTPGNNQPVPAPIVEQLKKAPALVVIPQRSAQKGTGSAQGTTNTVHFLNPGKRTTIGRKNDNDIVLPDKTVSSHHAEVFLDIDGFYISDLSSSHGTFVNQTKVRAPYLLSHSDRIKLGSTRLFFIDLQAGKELTTKSVGVRVKAVGTGPVEADLAPARLLQATRVTQKDTTQQTNVTICPRCGIANVPVARFCASCSTLL